MDNPKQIHMKLQLDVKNEKEWDLPKFRNLLNNKKITFGWAMLHLFKLFFKIN